MYHNPGGGVEWTRAELTNPGPAETDLFGQSVGIDGRWALVGAPMDTTDRPGAAYMFHKTQSGDWVYWQDLTLALPSPLAPYDRFGDHVGLSEEDAIVGALGTEVDGQTRAGKAYMFRRNETDTWTFVNELQSPSPTSDEEFGESVDVDGKDAVVGTRNTNSPGEAYMFRNTGAAWTFQQTLVPAAEGPVQDGEIGAFGSDVSLHGGRVLVGAGSTTVEGFSNAGAAYIFKPDPCTGEWHQVAQLTPPDPEGGEFFGDGEGHAVSIHGHAIVGAPFAAGTTGAAYVFYRNCTKEKERWKLLQKLTVVEPDTYFGFSVAIDCQTAVVGPDEISSSVRVYQ